METAQRKRSTRSSLKRDWGHMNSDLLVCIFQNLVLSELLQAVPHVCSTWRMAVSKTEFFISGSELNHECLDTLSTRKTVIYTNLLRMALKTEATHLDHLQFCEDVMLPEDIVLLIAQRSTCIKKLSLMSQSSLNHFSPSLLSKTLPFWNNLTSFEAVLSRPTATTCIRLVGHHCKKLTHLGIHGIIEKPLAKVIATCFPDIQSMDFRSSFFSVPALDIILEGAKNLKNIDLMHCICADEDDLKSFAMGVIKGKGAKDLKPETLSKLAALENFTYCGGSDCECCYWYYDVGPGFILF